MSKIITMDALKVSIHIPETKLKFRHWLEKGTPGSIKAKVIASYAQQMVLAFFDSKGECILRHGSPEEVSKCSLSGLILGLGTGCLTGTMHARAGGCPESPAVP